MCSCKKIAVKSWRKAVMKKVRTYIWGVNNDDPGHKKSSKENVLSSPGLFIINFLMWSMASLGYPFLISQLFHDNLFKVAVKHWRTPNCNSYIRTILWNYCCTCASKRHVQRRKSTRQSLTVKPNLFVQRIAAVRKPRTNLWNTFYPYIFTYRSYLEICTEVGECETNIFKYI